jgi:hypothetical protein
MPDSLTPEEKSTLRKMIRERHDKNAETYQDGLVAATASIQSVIPGKIVTAKQIEELRVEMGLSVAMVKPAGKKQFNFLPKQPTRKETVMKKRLSPEEKEIVFATVKDHTGGDENLTALELVDHINSKGITKTPVTLNVVNRARVLLKKGFKPKPAKKLKASEPDEAPPMTLGSGVLAMALAHFRKQREVIDRAIKNLEECIALETARAKS